MKANRGLKEMIKLSRGQTNENQENSPFCALPKIEKKSVYDDKESYNLNSGASSKRIYKSSGNLLPKEVTMGLTESEKSLKDDLGSKFEDQRREIEQKTQAFLSLQRNFESLSMVCKAEKTENAENKKIIAKLREEKSELQLQIDHLNKRVADMLDRVKKVDQDSESLKEEKKKAAKFKEDTSILTKKVDEIQKLYEKKCKETNDFDFKMKELIIINEKNNKNIQNLEQEKRKLLKEIESTKTAMKIIEAENQKNQANIEDLKLTIQNQQNQLLTNNIQLEKWINKFNEAKNTNNDNEIGILKSENNELKGKLIKALEQIESQNLQVKILRNVEDNLKNEIENLTNGLKLKDAQIKSSLQEIESLKQSNKQENQLISNYKELIDEYEIKIKNLQEKLNIIEDSLKNKQNSLTQNESLIQENHKLISKNEELSRFIEDLKCIQKNLSQDIQEKDNRINQLKMNNNNIIEQNESLKLEIQNLNKRLSLMSSNNNNILDKNSQKINEEILKLKNQLDSEIAYINSLKEQKRNSQIIEDKATKEIESLKQTIEIKEREIKSLKEDYQSINLKYQDLSRELDKYSNIKVKLDELQKKESILINVITKLEFAESSLINSLSCSSCMEQAIAPITCIPCGHTYCSKCLDENVMECPECGGGSGGSSNNSKKNRIEYRFRNKLLDEIMNKLDYNKLTFEAINKQYKSEFVKPT